MTRPRSGRRVDAVLSVLLVAGAGSLFLPWARSGRSPRNSFELFRSADRLGLLESRATAVMVVVWLALPFLAGTAVVALAGGRRRVGAGLSTVVGGALLGGACVVKVGPLPADGGTTVALLLGALIVAVAVSGLVLAGWWSSTDPSDPQHREAERDDLPRSPTPG